MGKPGPVGNLYLMTIDVLQQGTNLPDWDKGLNYQLTDIDMNVDDGINDDSYDISRKGIVINAL